MSQMMRYAAALLVALAITAEADNEVAKVSGNASVEPLTFGQEVEFDTEEIDTLGWVDLAAEPRCIVPTAAGSYILGAVVVWGPSSVGERNVILRRTDGSSSSPIAASGLAKGIPGIQTTQRVMTLEPVDPGECIYVELWQSANETLSAGVEMWIARQ